MQAPTALAPRCTVWPQRPLPVTSFPQATVPQGSRHTCPRRARAQEAIWGAHLKNQKDSPLFFLEEHTYTHHRHPPYIHTYHKRKLYHQTRTVWAVQASSYDTEFGVSPMLWLCWTGSDEAILVLMAFKKLVNLKCQLQ